MQLPNEQITQLLLFSTGLAVSAGFAGILTYLVREWAIRLKMVDTPNHRSMHTRPIPRVGGIAIVGGFFAGCLYFYLLEHFFPQLDGYVQLPEPWILIGAVVMAFTGLYDDLRGLSAKAKLYFQCVAAAMIVFAGFRFNLPFISVEEWGLFGEYLSMAITFFWIVAMINALNLLDGMDGLAAGTSVIAISSIAIALAVNGYGADLAFVTVFIGALIGFLLHNSHPASIFMGDTGSLFLGFMLATFALPITAQPSIELSYLVPVFALGLPILDTCMAIVRRLIERKGIFSADKDHIHHRMSSRLGLSHHRSVLSLYGVSLFFGLIAIWVAVSDKAPSIALALSFLGFFIVLLLVKLGYLKPTLLQNGRLLARRR